MTDLWLKREDYDDLRTHYTEAVKAGQQTFIWRGREMDVRYVKYLLEYLGLN